MSQVCTAINQMRRKKTTYTWIMSYISCWNFLFHDTQNEYTDSSTEKDEPYQLVEQEQIKQIASPTSLLVFLHTFTYEVPDSMPIQFSPFSYTFINRKIFFAV